MPSATAEFSVGSWNEETFRELGSEAKLTRASVTGSLSGDIAGTRVWVLPNPSGLNAHWPPAALAAELLRLRGAAGLLDARGR